MTIGLIVASLMANIYLAIKLYIQNEQSKWDQEVIASKQEAIQELYSIIQENDFEFTTPYDEFLSYLDEEGTL